MRNPQPFIGLLLVSSFAFRALADNEELSSAPQSPIHFLDRFGFHEPLDGNISSISSAPKCHELEYLFEQSDDNQDGRSNIQKLDYLRDVFRRYSKSGIQSNKYVSLIFNDEMFQDLWMKEAALGEYLHKTKFLRLSFLGFLQALLYNKILYPRDSCRPSVAVEEEGLLLVRLTGDFGYYYLIESHIQTNFDSTYAWMQDTSRYLNLEFFSKDRFQEVFDGFDYDSNNVLDKDEFSALIVDMYAFLSVKLSLRLETCCVFGSTTIDAVEAGFMREDGIREELVL